MEPVAGPVLPWSGMSETAGAPSSSSGVEVSAAHVCLNLIRRCVEVSKGLRKAIRKSLKSVRGSPMSMGMRSHILKFDEEQWQALSAGLARLDEFDTKKDNPRDQATDLHIGSQL